MDEELKLGFLRLGRWLEDPVNMGLGLLCAWLLVVLTITIALALSLVEILLLILAGIAAAVLLKRPIEFAARRWRRGRLELEGRRSPASDGA